MHLSIDFWRTLAFSNPEYSKRRLDFLENKLDIEREMVKNTLTEIGRYADYYNSSGHITIDAMYQMVFAMLSKKSGSPSIMENSLVKSIRSHIDDLFLEYPPLLNQELFRLIDLNAYKTFNLSSNTGYISGSLIKTFLNDSLTELKMDFHVFSDEIGFSKPQSHFFDFLKSQVNSETITHLGDDFYADIYGANASGFNALYYNNNKLIKFNPE